jgi:hypothetical protein
MHLKLRNMDFISYIITNDSLGTSAYVQLLDKY